MTRREYDRRSEALANERAKEIARYQAGETRLCVCVQAIHDIDRRQKLLDTALIRGDQAE